MRTIGTLTGEGFASVIEEDATGRVFFWSDADICADGANGHRGGPAAYVIGDKGTEFLANGGLTKAGKIKETWARNVFIMNEFTGQPKVFPGNILASKTWYKHPNKKADDPTAYLDSETEDYIVVPPLIISGVKGVVRGAKAKVSYNGKTVDAVVGDKGPARKTGEISISLARKLGIPFSPKHGGIDKAEVFYEIWPGIPAPGYVLQPA